jgi:hypothetical protein
MARKSLARLNRDVMAADAALAELDQLLMLSDPYLSMAIGGPTYSPDMPMALRQRWLAYYREAAPYMTNKEARAIMRADLKALGYSEADLRMSSPYSPALDGPAN